MALDAQSAGGLLISVDADRADELVDRVRTAGAEVACVVGHVTELQDVSLVLGR